MHSLRSPPSLSGLHFASITSCAVYGCVANGTSCRSDLQYKGHYVLCLTHAQDETDEQYLRKVADVMHSLFRTHGSTLLPLFDQLLPTFAGMLVS